MEQLKRIGELGKLHYEKIILTIALAGLAVAAWLFYQKGEEAKATIVKWKEPVLGKQKTLPPTDLSTNETMRAAASQPPNLDWKSNHLLFNSVKWQQRPDGARIKIATGNEVGPAQLEYAARIPLKHRLVLTRFGLGPDGAPAFFQFTSQDEAATFMPGRGAQKRFYLNTTDSRKGDVANLVAVRGKPEDPEVVLELTDTRKQVALSKDKPFEEVKAYLADLKYKVDGRTFNNVREGQEIEFAGEKYKIIAIKQNEVVVSALLNSKNYTVPYSAQE